MRNASRSTVQRPRDIRERLFEFACEVVRAAQFLNARGAVGRALCSQLIASGTSAGANAYEADGASSRNDFIAKMRISLREAKETHFRLRVCRRCDLLDTRFDPLLREADELTRILATIVRNTIRNTPP